MSINTGVRYAMSGRPGAVYIDLPAEIINAPIEREDAYFPDAVGDPPRPQGDPRAVEEALRGATDGGAPVDDHRQRDGLVASRERAARIR